MTIGVPATLASGAASAAAFAAGVPVWLMAVVVALAAYFLLRVWAPVWVEDRRERTRTRRIENDRREDRRIRENAGAPSRPGGTVDLSRMPRRRRTR
jgi:hypothetical protein